MPGRWTLVVLVTAGLLCGQDDLRRVFERARLLEERNQNLVEAIRLYGEVVRRAKQQRALAARAQFQQGALYERLGRQQEAQRAFRAVVTDFPEQADLVRQARARLGASAMPVHAMTDRMVLDDPTWGALCPSADGRFLAFTDYNTGDLAVRDLTTGETRHVTAKKNGWKESSAHAVGARFSPRGDRIAYRWFPDADELRLIGSDGTGDRLLFKDSKLLGLYPRDWSPDGQQILVDLSWRDSTAQMGLISVADGSLRTLVPAQKRNLGEMAFSPDGKWIAFTDSAKDGGTGADIFVISVNGGHETPLIRRPANDSFLGWSPDGRRLIFSSDRLGTPSIWTVRYSGGRVQGEPEIVKQDVTNMWPLGMTRQGAFYYTTQKGVDEVYIAEIDPASGKTVSEPRPVSQDLASYGTFPSWSPDGDQLLLWQRGPSSDRLVFYSKSARQARGLTPQLTDFWRPQWHPSGKWVASWGFDAESRPGYYRIDPVSGRAERVLTPEQAETNFEGAWSSDGKTFYNRFGDWERGLFRLNMETGERTILFVPPKGSNLKREDLALSPDERLLAFHLGSYPSSEMSSLMVVPTAGGEARIVYSIKAPQQFTFGAFAWSLDMKYIYALFGTEHQDIWRIPVGGGEPMKIGLGRPRMKILRMNPDGRTIAFQSGGQKTEVWVLENFLPTENARR